MEGFRRRNESVRKGILDEKISTRIKPSSVIAVPCFTKEPGDLVWFLSNHTVRCVLCPCLSPASRSSSNRGVIKGCDRWPNINRALARAACVFLGKSLFVTLLPPHTAAAEDDEARLSFPWLANKKSESRYYVMGLIRHFGPRLIYGAPAKHPIQYPRIDSRPPQSENSSKHLWLGPATIRLATPHHGHIGVGIHIYIGLIRYIVYWIGQC